MNWYKISQILPREYLTKIYDENYGAWISPDGVIFPVRDEYAHKQVANEIIAKNPQLLIHYLQQHSAQMLISIELRMRIKMEELTEQMIVNLAKMDKLQLIYYIVGKKDYKIDVYQVLHYEKYIRTLFKTSKKLTFNMTTEPTEQQITTIHALQQASRSPIVIDMFKRIYRLPYPYDNLQELLRRQKDVVYQSPLAEFREEAHSKKKIKNGSR